MKKNVIIVGAGLAGSLCALYMLKREYNVSIYERRPDMRKIKLVAGRSINLALSTRGWTALEKVEADKHVKRIAIPMPKRIMHDVEGNLTDQYYGNQDQAIYSVPRAELNVLLMNLAEQKGANIFFNHKCIDINIDRPELVFLNTITNQNITLNCDLIVGADGAFSSVRDKIAKLDHFQTSQYNIDHGLYLIHI